MIAQNLSYFFKTMKLIPKNLEIIVHYSLQIPFCFWTITSDNELGDKGVSHVANFLSRSVLPHVQTIQLNLNSTKTSL